MKHERLRYRFVEFIPEELQEDVIYISIEYRTVTHRCCCGCGREVVTPLGPTDWRLIFDGKTVSLEPSIGSWSLPCQSHYWIRNSQVKWAEQWTREQVLAGRAYDRRAKNEYFGDGATDAPTASVPIVPANPETPRHSYWGRFISLFRRT